MLGDEAEAVTKEVKPKLLADLRTYPGPSKRPWGGWSTNPQANERARRKYFAMVRSGEVQTRNGRYVRTGGYAKSWVVQGGYSRGGFVLTAASNYRGAIFVGGTLAKDLRRARRTKIPGHKKTGWQTSAGAVNFWFDKANEAYLANTRTLTRNLGETRRARRTQTPRRRR